MKLIVGLGNPGAKYEDTRHNIGFKVIDVLSYMMDIPLNKTKFNGLFGQGQYRGEKVILLKPLTYMNLSGESVGPLVDYFDIDIDDVIIVYDDLDLPVGKLRIRKKGSAGGHNGMKSIIYHLRSDSFKRIRIGVGRPNGRKPIVDYVLEDFPKEEYDTMTQVVKDAAKACDSWLDTPFEQVMNQFNQ